MHCTSFVAKKLSVFSQRKIINQRCDQEKSVDGGEINRGGVAAVKQRWTQLVMATVLFFLFFLIRFLFSVEDSLE